MKKHNWYVAPTGDFSVTTVEHLVGNFHWGPKEWEKFNELTRNELAELMLKALQEKIYWMWDYDATVHGIKPEVGTYTYHFALGGAGVYCSIRVDVLVGGDEAWENSAFWEPKVPKWVSGDKSIYVVAHKAEKSILRDTVTEVACNQLEYLEVDVTKE